MLCCKNVDFFAALSAALSIDVIPLDLMTLAPVTLPEVFTVSSTKTYPS